MVCTISTNRSMLLFVKFGNLLTVNCNRQMMPSASFKACQFRFAPMLYAGAHIFLRMWLVSMFFNVFKAALISHDRLTSQSMCTYIDEPPVFFPLRLRGGARIGHSKRPAPPPANSRNDAANPRDPPKQANAARRRPRDAIRNRRAQALPAPQPVAPLPGDAAI